MGTASVRSSRPSPDPAKIWATGWPSLVNIIAAESPRVCSMYDYRGITSDLGKWMRISPRLSQLPYLLVSTKDGGHVRNPCEMRSETSWLQIIKAQNVNGTSLTFATTLLITPAAKVQSHPYDTVEVLGKISQSQTKLTWFTSRIHAGEIR